MKLHRQPIGWNFDDTFGSDWIVHFQPLMAQQGPEHSAIVREAYQSKFF